MECSVRSCHPLGAREANRSRVEAQVEKAGWALGLTAIAIGASIAASLIAREAEGVVVAGRVTYDGPIPAAVENPEAGAKRALVAVDETQGLRDAVVWLEGAPIAAGAGPAMTEPAVMDQVEFTFVPHVLAVQAGRAVEFRNGDNANHGVSAASIEPGNAFNVTTPPGGVYKHRFTASRFPVAIGCPLHPAMAAWIFVFDHPCFAVTDESGRFSIAGVPPGRYRLEVRHPSGGMRTAREILVEPCREQVLLIEFREADLKVNR